MCLWINLDNHGYSTNIKIHFCLLKVSSNTLGWNIIRSFPQLYISWPLYRVIDLQNGFWTGCTAHIPIHINILTWNIASLYFTLTAHNWQNWKRVFLTCPCHEIYKDEAVGLKSCKYWKITNHVNMWNLGRFAWNFDILLITASLKFEFKNSFAHVWHI